VSDGDLLERLRAVSSTAAFNRWLRFEVYSANVGDVELRLPWRDEFGQYNGFLHASIIGGLIDTACGFAAYTMVGGVLASQFSVRCLRPALAEVFAVRGRIVKAGKQQVFASAELYDLAAPQKLMAVGDALLVPTATQ
jgi:uncharacterized protein (TIGR00369 family)